MTTTKQSTPKRDNGNEERLTGGLDEMARKAKPATIIRAPKDRENPYKAVRRATFEDKRLSWEARGILGYLLVKPDTWEINISDLWRAGDVGRDKIYRILAHLEKYGYLERVDVRDKGKFVGVRYLLHEEPLPENQETAEAEPVPEIGDAVDAAPFPENQETARNGFPAEPLPENQEVATRVAPFPEKPDTVFQEHNNKEDISNQEPNSNKERTNEHSFIHSLPSDQQIEFDDCVDLLTDPDVGLDEPTARKLAAKHDFDFLLRQVFAWIDNRQRNGTYVTTGALLTRIRRPFSAPALTTEQKRSALYERFHSSGYFGDERRHRDYAQVEAAP